MEISFVIISWNARSFLERSVSCLVETLAGTGLSYEILIVDNGSGDGTAEMVRKWEKEHPGRVVGTCLAENMGTTVSRNIALRRAKGRVVCIMDSDVEVKSNVFADLIALLDGDSGIGIAVPRVLYASGRWQKSFDQFPTLSRKIKRFFMLKRMEAGAAPCDQVGEGGMDVDYAISAFWLFKRSLLESVGLLDERIFYSPEDVDFCLRVWKAGLRIVYLPRVTVVHHTQEISRGWKINRFKLSHLKGLFYLFAKHRYFFKRPTFASGRSCSAA